MKKAAGGTNENSHQEEKLVMAGGKGVAGEMEFTNGIFFVDETAGPFTRNLAFSCT
jgi:hypothetical protein